MVSGTLLSARLWTIFYARNKELCIRSFLPQKRSDRYGNIKRAGYFHRKNLRRHSLFLCGGKSLPSSYDDHALRGELVSFREFHLGYDLLVKYRRRDELHVINVVAIGTHSELFGS